MTIDSINQTDTEFSEAIAYILKMQQYFAQDMFVKVNSGTYLDISAFYNSKINSTSRANGQQSKSLNKRSGIYEM